MKIDYKTYLIIAVWWLIEGFSCTLWGEPTESGVLLTKSYPWSPKTEINNAYEFKSLVDHTGYYSVNPGPQEYQIQVGVVVDVVYDAELTAKNITSQSELALLLTAQTRLESLSLHSANVRAALAGRLAAIKSEIGYFKQGYLKIDGQWVSAAEVKRRRDLANAAQQQADDDAEANNLTSVLDRHDLTLERCAEIVNRLKTIHKDEDPRATLSLTRFQNDQNAVLNLKKETQIFLQTVANAPVVTACGNAKSLGQLPPPPKDLARSAGDFLNRLTALESKVYYKTLTDQLHSEVSGVAGLMRLWSEITKLNTGDLQGVATDATDDNAPGPSSPLVQNYPTLNAAVGNLRGLIVSASQEFGDHCKRALELEKLGRTADAIEEYKKASDIAKEPAVLQAMQDLREKSLGL